MRAKPLFVALMLVAGCDTGVEPCEPTLGVVERVLDGDTVVLSDGQRVRSMFTDAPDLTGPEIECFAEEATNFKEDLVLGREVELVYGPECRDELDRIPASIFVGGNRDVSANLVERGYSCVDSSAPVGDPHVDDLLDLEDEARQAERGMWAICSEVPCVQ